MAAGDSSGKVRELFSDYLEKNGLRKTPERFTILEEIYLREDHFEADTLFSDIHAKAINVSKATVYNTLELLVSCELVKRHQFGENIARYEKSYGYMQHDHIICLECHKVMEFCDPRIHQIQTTMEELLGFEISYHSLNLYGRCQDCREPSKES